MSILYLLLSLGGVCLVMLYLLRWRIVYRLGKTYKQNAETIPILETKPFGGLCGESPYKIRNELPGISIVVPAIDQDNQLKQILPLLLEQKSTDFTQDFVAGLQYKHENLRYVNLPDTLRFIALRKMAITLGLKAARYEWVILVNPETIPVCRYWLKAFSHYLNPDLDFISGYYNYYDEENLATRRAVLERIKVFTCLSEMAQYGRIMGCETSNLAIRKSFFLQTGGFSDHLSLPFGEESLWAYTKVHAARSRYVTDHHVYLEELLPPSDELLDKRVKQLETMRYMSPQADWLVLREWSVSMLTYAFCGLILTYLILRFYHDLSLGIYTMDYIYGDFIWVVETVLYLCAHIQSMKPMLCALKAPSYTWYLCFYDLLYPWYWGVLQFIRWKRKRLFVRHYL